MSRDFENQFNRYLRAGGDLERFRAQVEGRDMVTRYIEELDGRNLAARLGQDMLASSMATQLGALAEFERTLAQRAYAMDSVQEMVDRAAAHADSFSAFQERAQQLESWQRLVGQSTVSQYEEMLEGIEAALRPKATDWNRLTGRDFVEQALQTLTASESAIRFIEGQALDFARNRQDFASYAEAAERILNDAPLFRSLLQETDWAELEHLASVVAEDAEADAEEEGAFQVNLEPLFAFFAHLVGRYRKLSRRRKGRADKVAVALLMGLLPLLFADVRSELVGVVLNKMFESNQAASGKPAARRLGAATRVRVHPDMVSDRPLRLHIGPSTTQRLLSVVPAGMPVQVEKARHGWVYVSFKDPAGDGAQVWGWAKANHLRPKK